MGGTCFSSPMPSTCSTPKQGHGNHSLSPKGSKIASRLTFNSAFGGKSLKSYSSCTSDGTKTRDTALDSRKQIFILTEDIRQVYAFDPKIIGSGRFGSVRTATLKNQPQCNKKFAVKSLSKEKLGKDNCVVKRELRILPELDHPNIVRFYNCYEDEKDFHIVMEYCSGGELLEKLIDKGRFEESECALIFEKLFSAIKYLHEHGIVHRDLKPENIVFSDQSPDSEIKLIDFSLSRKVDEAEKLQSIVGTPSYVAPEVLKGSYDYRCDYWSIGALLYLMLGGTPPFEGQTNSDVFSKILSGTLSFEGPHWGKISSKAKDLISKLLVVDPNARYDATKALKHPWFKNIPKTKIAADIKRETASNLKAFALSKRFRKEALIVAVSYLDNGEIKQLRDVFRSYDKGNTGEITLKDLQTALGETGSKHSKKEVRTLIDEIDIQGKSVITYTEFLAAAMDTCACLTKEKLMIVFKHFDNDNSNFITHEDLRIVMNKTHKQVSCEEIKLMTEETELYHDGKISFSEFCMMMHATDV